MRKAALAFVFMVLVSWVFAFPADRLYPGISSRIGECIRCEKMPASFTLSVDNRSLSAEGVIAYGDDNVVVGKWIEFNLLNSSGNFVDIDYLPDSDLPKLLAGLEKFKTYRSTSKAGRMIENHYVMPITNRISIELVVDGKRDKHPFILFEGSPILVLESFEEIDDLGTVLGILTKYFDGTLIKEEP
jgi:hypothetical protein